ncbi:DUF3868 domain-containing protein [Oscillospiraceae bacterium N12]|jgi:outer membrane protein OmpA-like peptidoglycan-associated protein|uniref:DUF3868 domain-containing protein n=1 Tax=Jilunia laotingensis TaxID=2763675 RepID=A0A926F6Y1_9BACT|nr:DUF3868 domain-containing protein [Jilunia laotingensis]MBC8594032.1 DUF3868 domain-containing protein [Jilunia laotingensis]
MKTKIVYLLLALVIALPAGAQKLYNDALSLSDVSLWQQGNSLYIDMKIDMSNLAVSPQRSLTLTPLLTDGQHNVALENIIINGRRRQKAYIRGIAIKQELPAGIVIPYEKRGVLDYTQVIPYEPWMENASLNLVENLCGCGNNEEMIAQELISNDVSTEAKRLAAMAPIVAYIQPAVEVVKERSEQYEAHLDFPVNKAVILPEFMNNHKELTNIQTMFDKIQNDKNLTVTGISIEGFASPEGPLKLNEKLSQNRAEALKKYLTTNEKIPANLYKVSFGGENWDGLVKALETSSMKDKETFISIIKNTSDDALRKKEIMRVGGGAPYRTMLKEIYPGLRKVNLKLEYTVANFDVQQGRIVIKTNPKYLSLNEMYQVANSYPKGSDDFVNVFDIAVRMYPNDPVANLNSAAVALSRKDIKTAMRFMEKANKQTAEYLNNSGVYYFLNGDINQAIANFSQAAQMGNEAAKGNMKQLQKILNAKKK